MLIFSSLLPGHNLQMNRIERGREKLTQKNDLGEARQMILIKPIFVYMLQSNAKLKALESYR